MSRCVSRRHGRSDGWMFAKCQQQTLVSFAKSSKFRDQNDR